MSTSTYTLAGLRILRLEPAGAGGWLLSFATSDRALFAEAVEIIKDEPEHERRWVATERAWWLTADALRDVCYSLPDVAEAFEAWHGGQSRKRSKGRDTSRPSPRIPAAVADALQGVPSDTVDAFAGLHLLPSAPVELVKAAHRIAAKRLHPDKGGQHRAMVAANLAYEAAALWAEAREDAEVA